jgi:uncharacterized membrane protein YgdD (TMEM256/DUF423 family)
MNRRLIITASLLGALAVALGAFGAHGLRGLVSERAVNTFETAVRYQFYHVFALLIIAILFKDFSAKWLRRSATLLLIGMLLFSGSLYLLTFIQAAVIPGYDWIGAITPVGGLCFIAGWILMLVAVWDRKSA